jgi:hypothetical protein
VKHSHDNRHSNDTGHEASSIQVGGIAWFIIGLSVGVVFIGWLMAAVLNRFEGREQKAELESRPSPFTAERPNLPPEPRLQLAPNSEERIAKNEPPNLKTQHPLEEIKELRHSWDQELNGYGWIDEQAGVVRIPIDDAKRILLERGLPTRAAKKPEAVAAGGETRNQ